MADTKYFNNLPALPAWDNSKVVAAQTDDANHTGYKAVVDTTLNPAASSDAKLVTQKAIDDNVAHKTGDVDEEIDGIKTFTDNSVFTQDVTIYDDLGVGGTGDATNGQIRVRDKDNIVRVNLEARDDGSVYQLVDLNISGGIVQTDGSGKLSTSTVLPDGTTATTQSPSDDSTKLATTAYVDSAIVGGVNEDNIYYVGGHGDDTTNDGLNIGEAFRFVAKGISEANSKAPSETNQYVVNKIDAVKGEQFSLSSKPWIHVYAPNTTLISGSNIVDDDSSVTIRGARFSSSGAILISKNGSGAGFFKSDKLYHTTTGNAVFLAVNDGGVLFSQVGWIKKLASGDNAIQVYDGTIYNNSQKIDGDIVVDNSQIGKVVTHDLDEDVIVGNGARLDLLVSGKFTGSITAGASSVVNLICSERTGAAGDNIDSTATFNKLVLSGDISTGADEDNIYYVGKHGADSTNDGKNSAQAFLTDAKALTEIAGQTPSITNQYTLKTLDAGVYTGSMAITSQYIHVSKPNATVKTNNATITSNSTLDINVLQRESGVGNIIIKTGTGKAIINAKKVINSIPTGSGIYIDNGILEANINELTVPIRTDTLISANPATTNKALRLIAKTMRGKIFTTSITDKYYITTDFIDSDFSVHTNSEIHLTYKEWTGNIVSSAAGSKIYLTGGKRNSNISNDVFNALALVYRNGETFRRHTTAVNYNPSALTDHRIIAVTNTDAPRSVVISTEDIQSASPESPRYFTVKDESLGAGTNAITISGESGNIDGAANFVLNVNGGSVEFYSDGTNLWLK